MSFHASSIEPEPEVPFGVPGELMHGEHLGWRGFGDFALIGQMTLVMVMAMLLSAIIAYHPSSTRRASSISDFEKPKIFIMYAIIGSLIALIVKVQPSMALVVFGIGGLLRFRTFVGNAKDTGRVILVTVLGLCCGLELYVVAVLGTIFGWLLILALDGRSVGRLIVQGVDRQFLAASAAAHVRILEGAGCRVLGEKRNVLKGVAAFVYRAKDGIDARELESQFATLPPTHQGAILWESV